MCSGLDLCGLDDVGKLLWDVIGGTGLQRESDQARHAELQNVGVFDLFP